MIRLLLGFAEGFWIGGTNLGNGPHYYWMGNKTPMNFTNWLERQPDNKGNHSHCIEIRADYGLKWNDQWCGTLNNFICEELTVAYGG